MTDDIVTRLRSFDSETDVFFIDENTFAEAAEQIERLRTIGKELLDALTEMADKGMLPKITFRLRDAAQTFEQAVRGEGRSDG